MSSFLDGLRRAVESAAKGASKAAATPAARPAAARPRTADDGGWSNLMLRPTSTTTNAAGGTHYNVKPAKPKDVKPKLSKEEKEWAEIEARQEAHLTGDFPGINNDPAHVLKENTTTAAELEAQDAQHKQQVAEAQRKVRAEMLGVEGDKPPAPADAQALAKSIKTDVLSADEYNALTPKQRSAVDFNTLLSTAVKHDLDRQKDYTKSGIEKDAEYKIRSQELFGDDRGSDLYAPETLAVLSKLKIDDKVADLDDYLGLKVAITEDDLKMLDGSDLNETRQNFADMPVTLSGQKQAPGETTTDRFDYVNSVANKTEALQQTLAKGNELLQSISATAQNDIRGDIGRLGGQPDAVKTQLGFGQGELDQTFKDYFEVLGNTGVKATTDEILADARANMDPEAFNSFLDYAEVRSRNSKEYGVPLGEVEGAKYRKPEEFRKLLGLED